MLEKVSAKVSLYAFAFIFCSKLCILKQIIYTMLHTMNIPTVVGKVPTTTYLRKFVEFIEDVEPNTPIDLHSAGVVPKFLRGLLVGKKKLYMDYPPRVIAGKDDNLRYQIDEKLLDSGEIFITKRHINIFNSFVYAQFHSHLFFKIRLEMKKGMNEKEIIWDYMQLLGIEEDEYSLSSIKRQITRLRTSKHMPSLRNKKGFSPH